MAIHEDSKNREEILAMDGVCMISDIINHILANGTEKSSAHTEQSKKEQDQADEIPEK